MNVKSDLAALTADVVAAYVANNPSPSGQLAELIPDLHDELASFLFSYRQAARSTRS